MYTQSIFWSKNKKNVYPSIPPFCYIKMGFKGVYVSRTCFPMKWEQNCQCHLKIPKQDFYVYFYTSDSDFVYFTVAASFC